MVTLLSFYDLETTDIDNKRIKLSKYKRKVSLVVNVASFCGFTPQYTELENLYEDLKDQNFEILAFPCNQFGSQEPGTPEEIKEFCHTKYDVHFPLFAKIDVKGDKQSDIYKFLTQQTKETPQWNFHKYIINKEGKVIASFPSKITPLNEKLVSIITSALETPS